MLFRRRISKEPAMAKPSPGVLPAETLQTQIKSDRASRVAQHKAAMTARRSAAAPKQAPLNILADGDSWFDYPLYSDVIDWVKKTAPSGTLLLNLAHYGDAATQTLGVSRRQQIIASLRDPEQGPFDAVL